MMSSKNQTIEEYINENLQLRTLKIKKFSFQNSLSADIGSCKRIKSSHTTRDVSKNYPLSQFSSNGWEPKLSYRKLMNEPKVLLSVEKRKIKTSESTKRANSAFSPPKSRLGFRGQKVRSQSFYAGEPDQKIPQRLNINNSMQTPERTRNKIPNLHFNYKYIIEKRRNGSDHLSMEQKTKKGSNQGYFACFGSQNFRKYLQKNIYRPHNNKTGIRQQIMYRKSQMQVGN